MSVRGKFFVFVVGGLLQYLSAKDWRVLKEVYKDKVHGEEQVKTCAMAIDHSIEGVPRNSHHNRWGNIDRQVNTM